MANITTQDTYGGNCDSNVSLQMHFNMKVFTLRKPCSNAFYFVMVKLLCDSDLQQYNLTMRTPPDAPRNVDLKATNRSIQVTWSPPPGRIQLYKVILQGGRTNEEIKENWASSTSSIFINLEPYTNYNVTVTAKNEDHWGMMSVVKTIKTLDGAPRNVDLKATNSNIQLMWSSQPGRIQPYKVIKQGVRTNEEIKENLTSIPSMPRNLKVFSKSATYATISWDVPDSAYEIIRNYSIAWRTKRKHLKTEYTEDTQFNATDLAPYTDYEFKVRAATTTGWGDWSTVLRVKTDASVPSEPLNLTESGVTSSSILIEWLAPEHKNGPYLNYIIRWIKIEVEGDEYDYFDDDNNVTTDLTLWTRDEVNTTSYEICNLDSYTNYSVKVCGKTTAGLGNCTISLVIQTAAGIPSSPAALKTLRVQSTSLMFQWSSPEVINGPLKGYVIHWGITGTGGSYFLTNMTSYEGFGLRPYTEYFFMVAAETQGGRGPFSSVCKRTTISTPSIPRNLVSTSVTDHSVLLEWLIPEHPSAPFLQYTVKWRQVSAGSSTQVHETNSTSYKIRDLLQHANYSIQIKASTNAGEGPWTEVLSVSTLEKGNSSAIIAGSVVGSLIAFILIVCIALFYMAKTKGGLKQFIHSKPTSNSAETIQTTVPMEVINDTEKVSLQNFDEHVLKLMTHGYYKLGQEFEKLGKESPAFPTNEAKKNENLTKNRWVKILPFDNCRVKLLPVGDEVEPDFINASYISGDSYLLEYIATQGPLPNTVNDFWKMIWQESVFLMVMLTQCVERAKRTCEKYWPAAGSTNKYGDVEVHCISESITPAYIQRLFLVTQDGKQRHIVHLHYMNWPVSGCPKSPDDFLSFVRAVRGQVSCGVTGPMLVHCSAGIGRTGTFIAVDRLSQQLVKQCEEVDIYGTVLDMKRYRANVVQTEDQYYFIHLCVQRIIQGKRQEMEDDYGGGIYSN